MRSGRTWLEGQAAGGGAPSREMCCRLCMWEASNSCCLLLASSWVTVHLSQSPALSLQESQSQPQYTHTHTHSRRHRQHLFSRVWMVSFSNLCCSFICWFLEKSSSIRLVSLLSHTHTNKQTKKKNLVYTQKK